MLYEDPQVSFCKNWFRYLRFKTKRCLPAALDTTDSGLQPYGLSETKRTQRLDTKSFTAWLTKFLLSIANLWLFCKNGGGKNFRGRRYPLSIQSITGAGALRVSF